MDKLYERADIYDLLENEQRWQSVLRHWQTLLDGKNITTLLDVSIGTGNLTLPLCELGVRLTGSDLNPAMLTRCRKRPLHAAFHRILPYVISVHSTRYSKDGSSTAPPRPAILFAYGRMRKFRASCV